MANLSSVPIVELSGIGEKRAKLFEKLGVTSIGGLLRFYPRDYIDLASSLKIADCQHDTVSTIVVTITKSPKEVKVKANMLLYKGIATDGQTDIRFTLFNNKYGASMLQEGQEFVFIGKVTGSNKNPEMASPVFYPFDPNKTVKPIYPQTEGLTSKTIESCVSKALLMLPDQIKDSLPLNIRQEYSLCHLRYATENIHQPSCIQDMQIAKNRLIFEELLVLQLGLFKLKNGREKQAHTPIKKDYTDEFFSLLPFDPTNAQKRAIADGISDMMSTNSMKRLVQGDVGSGKTAVAAALCYTQIKNDYQAVLMAPTEILAVQHYNSLKKLFEKSSIKVGLLVGSLKAKEKREVLSNIQNGELNLIVGTHALISDSVTFKNLGLVITDEQHRFGVAQRSSLVNKGKSVNLLVMSATPIPRTLALMIYGDLDVSVLDEMPPNRQSITTYLVPQAKRDGAYNFIKEKLDKGLQGYIVCPLVEESEMSPNLMSAQKYAQKLIENDFKDYKVALLHGKQKAKEKEETMAKFLAGEIDLLVSTTVIEVGVDVPNSVIMMIENAERFGLSQLHQLRGRVGRGKEKSYCILVSDTPTQNSIIRLNVMTKTSDGFKIADEDLKLRGPGDFFGEKQHGLPPLKVASFLDNMNTVKQAQKVALQILKKDPNLISPEYSGLKAQVKMLFNKVGEGGFN